MKLKIKKLHPEATLPRYATDGAACFDLHAVIDTPMRWRNVVREPISFPTGLAFEVPAGHAMLIFSRSGHGFKHDVRLANCVGVIDSDYRGEVQVKLTPDFAGKGMMVKHGDRIAQAMLVPYPQVEFETVAELTDTARGTGGFGSTGA